MTRSSLFTITASVLLGLFLGLVSPRPAAATTVYYGLDYHPGATVTMTCGWHGSCGDTPTAGSSLDWSNTNGASVFWRARGYRSDSAFATTMGQVVVVGSTSGGGCTQVEARFKDADGQDRGIGLYLHTEDTSESDFWVKGMDVGYFEGQKVGQTVSDSGNCAWDGYHLHQTATGMTQQSGNYPSYVNGTAYGNGTDVARRMFSLTWNTTY